MIVRKSVDLSHRLFPHLNPFDSQTSQGLKGRMNEETARTQSGSDPQDTPPDRRRREPAILQDRTVKRAAIPEEDVHPMTCMRTERATAEEGALLSPICLKDTVRKACHAAESPKDGSNR